MIIHRHYGPSLPEEGWVPAPRYLMRRDLVMERLSRHPKGRLLEIGTGPAVLLFELARSGWDCAGLEQSKQALKIARLLHDDKELAEIFDKPQANWSQKFDWILAMEVLEHIEDDAGALAQWSEWLKPGGRILLSVPAHQQKWNHTDVWAGHFRRYERNQLQTIFEDQGFVIEEIVSYGFPVANLIEPIRAFHHGRLLKARSRTLTTTQEMKQNTEESGVSRSLEKRLYPLYSNVIAVAGMRTAIWLQRMFLQYDLGTGYLVQARWAE